MKLLTTTLLAATATTLIAPAAFGQSHSSYQDCEDARQDRQVAGAIIGGILGAVIGNELADDSNNGRHAPRYRGRGHRRGHGYYRHHRRDRGNAEEVGTIAGAGVGALIGAGIAGGEDDCYQAGRDNRYPGKPAYSNDPYYRSSDAGWDTYSDDYAYSDSYGADYGAPSTTELAGGRNDYGAARVYTAQSSDGWTCEWQTSRRMGDYGQHITEQIYMCQGSDGIWRPYDVYTAN